MSPRASGHERALAAAGRRKAQGAYYTPEDVVGAVLDLALEPRLDAVGRDAASLRAVRVIDPACGSGRFLVAAAGRLVAALVAAGVAPGEAAAHVAAGSVAGIDVDPEAVALCRAAVAEALGVPVSEVAGIQVGDALADPGLAAAGSFDAVVGNPPFLSQLGASTARGAGEAARLRARFGEAIGPYTDPAAVFALLGVELVRPGGVVALVEPVPFLTARDAAAVRRAVAGQASITDLWLLGDRAFDAAVEVCVPVLVRRPPGTAAVRLHRGRRPGPAGRAAAPAADAPTWSHLLAALHGLPVRALRTDGVLGDAATATADFRDQYYGLAPHVVDEPDADDAVLAPLVTAGLIDPERLLWGEHPTRFNKVAYRHPRVVLGELPDTLRAWADTRLVPKVLLATQTRVLEAVVDPVGRLLPSVPVITVAPHGPADGDPLALWRIGAVLTCPAIAAEAAQRHLGSGRNAQVLRLRAQEVLALPLPADRVRWDVAARLLREGAPVVEVGAAMDAAYGVGDDAELSAWWAGQLPSRS